MKQYLLGSVVGGITLFLLGYIIYELLMHDPEFARGSAAALAGKAAPNLPPIIIAEILFGFLITRGLIKSGNIGSAGNAAKMAAVSGLVAGLAFSLIMFGTTELTTPAGVAWEAVTWGVRWGVAGLMISMIAGRTKAA